MDAGCARARRQRGSHGTEHRQPGRSRRRPRLTEEQARRQIETNLFGPLWVTKAVVPLLREQRAGHIIQVSSIGGVTAFPILGLYHASKWGLEGFSQALAAELAEFGVRVTIVEPGGFTTDWSGDSAGRAEDMRAYDGVRERRLQALGPVRTQPGDPQATGAAILELVDAAAPRCGSSSAAPACTSPGASTPRGSRRGRSGTGWRRWRRGPRARGKGPPERRLARVAIRAHPVAGDRSLRCGER